MASVPADVLVLLTVGLEGEESVDPHLLLEGGRRGRNLGVNVAVILTYLCIFCIDNH